MTVRYGRSPEAAAGAVFPPDFIGARERFLALAARAELPVKTYENPRKGPTGERLATDVALQGDPSAERVLVTISASHGIEGFCGSGCQADWLMESARAELPTDIALLHIHAINPYGFAWLRRVNEDGVDLNRNFHDFTKPLPENPDYDTLADALVPASLAPEAVSAAEARIAKFRNERGRRALQRARSGGQYKHPTGMFYGGTKPTWSRQILERIADDYELTARQRVAVIDYHTGLGPYGYGELIYDCDPGTASAATAVEWYGECVTVPALGTSSSVPKQGTAGSAFWQQRFGERVVYTALEYGTFSPDVGLRPMREDHVLHARGPVDWTSPETQRIKRNLRHHFFPDTQPWRELVLFRSRQVLAQALSGLAA
ncbi:MAG: M14 family metallopeptidase, partial [Stellaceae bacterium]